MKYLLLLLPVLALTYGCNKVDSNDLKDDVPYFQNYKVTFNKDDNTTLANAWYLVRTSNGARVELSNGASVTANGLSAGTSVIDKTRYTWTLNGNSDVTFLLTKSSGATITNKVERSEISDIAFGTDVPATFSKAKDFSFTWAGPALVTNESVTVRLVATGFLASANANGNTVTFKAADLASCPVGDATLELYRLKDIPLKNADAGAGGNIELQVQTNRKITVQN